MGDNLLETGNALAPRKLSPARKAILALMLLLVAALVLSLVVATGRNRLEKTHRVDAENLRRSQETRAILKEYEYFITIGSFPENEVPGCRYGAVRFSSPSANETGQGVLRSWFRSRFGPDAQFVEPHGGDYDAFMYGGTIVDAWGRPVLFRCPGPVHKQGWDLISLGPNGVYEKGGGDDIVLGEDNESILLSRVTIGGSGAAVGSETAPVISFDK